MDAGLASLESLLVINMKSLFHQYMKSLIVWKKTDYNIIWQSTIIYEKICLLNATLLITYLKENVWSYEQKYCIIFK